MRVFGYVANEHVWFLKLEKKVLECLFLGHLGGIDGYNLSCGDSKKCIINKDVKFEEYVVFTQVGIEDSISSLSLAIQVCNKMDLLECV